jgi:hypothetical protein
MAKKLKEKKLSDDNIVALVDEQVGLSVGYADSELSTERAKIIDYYNGTLPKPLHDGNSKYVSLDCYDAVESLKAALLETFSAGNKTVRFAAQNEDDVPKAKVATEYTDYVVHRQNDIYSIMNTVIHDSLIARAGICKVFWEESVEYDYEEFTDITDGELNMLLAQDNVELTESSTDELGLISGTISIEQDTSQVVIENVAPEEFLIETQAKSLKDVNFCAHRTKKTLSELRLEGYSEKLIDKIGEHSDVDLDTSSEVLARFDNVGNFRGTKSGGYQEQVRSVMVHEAYIMLDVDGSGVAELHRVVKAGNVLLLKEKTSRKPFVAFVPLPVPHSFYGNNYADKVVATQNARTILTRSILDHAMITNNPRYTVVKGGLTNPRELIDNRVGGLVNVSRPDAIAPLLQAPLNPYVYQTIQMLDEDKEDTTGVSKMSQGLNKDAISKQNSAAMVEQLATMSQQRQKIIARNFATQFVKPLFQEVYQLVCENESQERIVELSGNYVPCNPRDWKEKRDVVIELNLGYGEQEKESQKYLALHSMMTSDPNLSKMYQAPNQYALASKIMELTGIKEVSAYLTNPESLPPEQPDPAQELQLELMKKQIEVQERQTALGEMKAKMDIQISQMKLELEKAKAENQHAIQSDNLDLKEEQLKHKKIIDAAELVLAQQADEITAIASPNG